jgi:hypothetical protein
LPLLPHPAPDWPQWTVQPGVQTGIHEGMVDIVGDTSRFQYQLVSPPVAVTPHSTIDARMRVRVSQGRVCLGVLDGRQMQWLLVPERFQQQYSFDTRDNTHITFVLANCNVRRTDNDRTRLQAFAVTYGIS